MVNKYLFYMVLLVTLSMATFYGTVVVAQENIDTPDGYTRIGWVSEKGITSFFNAPPNIGNIDFVTIIQLSKNHVTLISTSSPRILEGEAVEPFVGDASHNWSFARSMAESLKAQNPKAKFVWNAPFFDVTTSTTPLSLGLKSSDSQGDYITSGTRPEPDIAQARRMLIIDNKTKTAKIIDFNENVFVSEGDQAVEGFHPLGSPSSKTTYAPRVYLGVRNEGRELLVYCSNSASNQEASNALISAGVPQENQIQVDGGGSATCGYNLPGHYFVEPSRALPHLMVAIPAFNEGVITINNLNVRSGPGTNNPSLQKLAVDSVVTVYEQKDGWMRISETEWVYGQYVELIKIFPYDAKVTSNKLNVRTGSGVIFSVTRQLELGADIIVYEEKDGWVRISDTEWVYGKYVR